MGRFGSFVVGAIVGAVTLFTLMHFHVVRSDDGTRLIRKVNPGFSETFADVRDYSIGDWREHPDLTEAMLQSQHHEMVTTTTGRSLQQKIGSMFGRVLGHQQ